MRSMLRSWVFGCLPIACAITFLALIPPRALAQSLCPTDHPVPVSWHVLPAQPCDGDSTRLVFSSCGPCVDLLGARFVRNGRPSLVVDARMESAQCILDICQRDSVSINLGQLGAGSYMFRFLVRTQYIGADSSICILAHEDSAFFQIGRCGPPPGPLPYVDDIVVGQRVVCVTYPCPDIACPHDSIPVFIRGTFPDDCFALRRIELVPSIETVIGPPTLRILIDDMACLGRPCVVGPVPWSANVLLPPLPPGNYQLRTELGKVTCSDSFPDSAYTALQAFHVMEQCSIPTAPTCFRISWGRESSIGYCNATISPGHAARVDFQIAPRVPLAGLQGDLVLGDVPARITNIEAIGHASGMHLDWRSTALGARFVLFAEHGAPIPPYINRDPVRDLGGWPVLRITVEQPAGTTIPSRMQLFARDLLGSDSTGIGVHECPMITLYPPPSAIICASSRCDLNGDATADVRDLVLMVHCAQGLGCPDSGVVDLDCDGNGTFELEDVLCCARYTLFGDFADSSGGRPEGSVRVGFGDVRSTESNVEVPFTLQGADRVGAARLALSYPADRYDVVGVDFPDGSEWLHLYEVRDGNIVIGLIGTSGQSGGARVVEMAVHLALKAGQRSGGEVRVVESQFSGPDGVSLEVDLGEPRSSLPSAALISLSHGQPNPFPGTTRFTVLLATAADLDVAIHDLSGRRVKGIFHERAEAGTRELTWDGRRENGSAAPSGVYFIRARVSGGTVSSRVVLLREQ